METPTNHKRVFISYSWDGDGHEDWVLQLATNLRSHGVDVMLDQWDTRLGYDLPFFMEQGLSHSHLVICVCSEQYVKKANAIQGGVGYEKRIIAAYLLNDNNRPFVIPIVKNNPSTSKLPTFLSGMKYVDFDGQSYYDCYQQLLERIYDEDLKKKPPLGENPFSSIWVSEDIQTQLLIHQIEYRDIRKEGTVSFDYKNNSGLFTIGSGEYEFTTMWSEAGYGCIHCYRDKVLRLGYNGYTHEFPPLEQIPTLFDFSSRCRCVLEGDIVILENRFHQFAALKVLKVVCAKKDIGHLLEFKYKIYVPGAVPLV